jgi:hypothetical protein
MLGYSPQFGVRADLQGGTIFTDPQFYVHHSLFSEWAVGERTSIGLRAEMLKVHFPDGRYYFRWQDPVGGDHTSWREYILDTNIASSHVYSFGFDLYRYAPGYTAPLGVYHKFGLKYSLYNAQPFVNSLPDTIPYAADQVMGGSLYAHYAYGRKFIVGERYFVNIAAKAGLGLNKKIWYGLVETFDNDGGVNELEIENMLLYSMNKAMFVSIELGFGILTDKKGK